MTLSPYSNILFCSKTDLILADLRTFADGNSAATALKVGGRLEGRYEVVTGDVSINVGVSKSFQQELQYAFFTFSQAQLQVTFDSYKGHIDEKVIGSLLQGLPHFDGRDANVMNIYKEIFTLLGTHIIVQVSYGSRMTMVTRFGSSHLARLMTFVILQAMWASNSNSEVNKNFAVDLGVAFQGLVTSGSFDGNISKEAQYKEFKQSLGKTLSCNGGDGSLADYIIANPSTAGIYDTYKKWVATADTNPAPTAFGTVPLWTVMFAAQDQNIKKYWSDFLSAYNYIVENPQVHRTSIRMTISGGYGAFDLLTPSGYLEPDPRNPLPQDAVLTVTNVVWSGFPRPDFSIEWVAHDALPPVRLQQHSTDIPFSFILTNYGEPVNIETARDNGGEVVVIFSSTSVSS